MDIVSHGLWAVAVGKVITERKLKTKLKSGQLLFWGIFPDAFAFGIPFVWMLWNVAFGGLRFSDFPRPQHGEPPAVASYPVYQIAPHLYNWSHSFVIFGAVLLVVWILRGRKLPWTMLGWPLHILMDIPTHTYRFYPTPFLWPISGVKFSGFSWGQPWFLALDYGLLLITFILLWRTSSTSKT